MDNGPGLQLILACRMLPFAKRETTGVSKPARSPVVRGWRGVPVRGAKPRRWPGPRGAAGPPPAPPGAEGTKKKPQKKGRVAAPLCQAASPPPGRPPNTAPAIKKVALLLVRFD